LADSSLTFITMWLIFNSARRYAVYGSSVGLSITRMISV